MEDSRRIPDSCLGFLVLSMCIFDRPTQLAVLYRQLRDALDESIACVAGATQAEIGSSPRHRIELRRQLRIFSRHCAVAGGGFLIGKVPTRIAGDRSMLGHVRLHAAEVPDRLCHGFIGNVIRQMRRLVAASTASERRRPPRGPARSA